MRIGYLSSDFREHPVRHFIEGILTHHDREWFEVHVYDNRVHNIDPLANRLKSLAACWHSISDLSTERACQMIAANNIDILVDLAGHTNCGRPNILANRVAPMQVMYLGYPNSSGLDNMDFRMGDSFADLPEYAAQNREEVLRLPHAM